MLNDESFGFEKHVRAVRKSFDCEEEIELWGRSLGCEDQRDTTSRSKTTSACEEECVVLNYVATVQWHVWGTGCPASHHRNYTSQNSIISILLLGRCPATLFKTRSILLGVVQAYVQVGTGRGAPRWLPMNIVIIPAMHVLPSVLHIWLFSPLFLIYILFHVHSQPRKWRLCLTQKEKPMDAR